MRAFGLVALALVSCGGTPALEHREETAPPLATEDPVELVPAAGLRWLLVTKPAALLAKPAFREAIEQVIPEPRILAFAERTGIDLRRCDTALVAGYDLTTVYAATGDPALASRVLTRFRERLRGGGKSVTAHSRLERIAGSSSETPEAALVIGERSALVSVGDPMLAVVAEAFALGRLERSQPALRGASLARLPPTASDGLAVLYVPGPFTGEWAHAAGGLFGNIEAVSISVSPAGSTSARVHFDLAGAFEANARERLLDVATDVASSPVGRVMGLDRPVDPPKVKTLSDRLTLELDLEIRPIADGLHAAISAEAWEILKLPSPNPE